jgi:hypothetical protein
MGFTPGTGYGVVPEMKDYRKDINEFYFKPMEELKNKTSQFDKLKLEGLDSGSVSIAKSFYDEINKLLSVLKNNQVVLQFRSVFVDLMKEMSAGQRALTEELAILKRRSQTDLVPGGLTAGVSRSLENINLGIREAGNLTPEQRLLGKDSVFAQRAMELKQQEATSKYNLDIMDKIERASVSIDNIMEVAEGFGASLSPDQLKEYVEQIPKERGEGPFYDLKEIDKGIEKNTADTVNRLDSLIENMGGSEAVVNKLDRIVDRVSGSGSGMRIGVAIERAVKVRNRAEDRGDQESVAVANKAINTLSKQMVDTVGYRRGSKILRDKRLFSSGRFAEEEFMQQALGSVDPEAFVERLRQEGTKRKAPWYNPFGGRKALGESREFKNLEQLQEKQIQTSVFSSKNLARISAASAVIAKLQQSGNNKIISGINDQISAVETSMGNVRKARSEEAGKGAPDETKIAAFNKELASLAKERQAFVGRRNKLQDEAAFYGTVKAMAAAGFAATELSKAFGLSEKNIKLLGAGTIGTLAAVKLASTVMGKELPESAKQFQEDLISAGKKVASGEKIGIVEGKKIMASGRAMMSEVSENTKRIFKGSADDIAKNATSSNLNETIKSIEAGLSAREKSLKEYGAIDTPYQNYLDLKKRHSKELLSQRAGESDEPYEDLQKRQKAETHELLSSLNRDVKRDVVSRYDKIVNSFSRRFRRRI